MIPFNFDYYKPDSIEEAVNIYEELALKSRKPLYYSGGTEIINFARTNKIQTSAVIDIKGIAQCRQLELSEKEIIIGSAVSLSRISETNYFPLLNKATLFPADHTTRDKITIGGNICGEIRYKEVVLPLLVSDCKVLISSKRGTRKVDINQVFDKKLLLEPGELLLQLRISRENLGLPFYAVKIINQGVTGYPLISIAAIKKDNLISVAISGLCAFPFRSIKLDEALNNENMTIPQKTTAALNLLPGPITTDIQGSAEYKSFVFKNVLKEILESLGGK